MNRRLMLGATLGLGATAVAASARWPTAAFGDRALDRALSDSNCRSISLPRAVRTASSTDMLSFAGTRLFKEGFLDDVGAAYLRATGRSIEILGGGCDDGLEAVRNGTAVIGGLCCPLAGGPASGMEHRTVAFDMKVVVAHPSVAVSEIAWPQLVALVTGEIRNWRQLGGRDRRVALVLHDHCPDYLEPARRMLLGERSNWSREALHVKTDQKHLETVARFESAVGVNSWILAEPFVRAGALKVLALDGVVPGNSAAANRRYRLVGPMNMIYRRWDARRMKPFFDFLFSPAGKEIVERRLITRSQVAWRI